MKKPLGVVLYKGPSVLDGSPIVVLATLKTANLKTGNMIQVWILRSDMTPTMAKERKLDDAVCGKCPHRHSLGGGCYVVLFHGPNKVYQSWKDLNYRPFEGNEHLFSGRRVRFGAYGDPAAVPYEILDKVAQLSDGVTGYTHQFGHPKFDYKVLNHCMVSVDTPSMAKKMTGNGLRYFRVKAPTMPLLEHEIECPSNPDTGISCVNCQLCDGALKTGKSIVIDSHGVLAKRFDDKFGISIKNIN